MILFLRDNDAGTLYQVLGSFTWTIVVQVIFLCRGFALTHVTSLVFLLRKLCFTSALTEIIMTVKILGSIAILQIKMTVKVMYRFMIVGLDLVFTAQFLYMQHLYAHCKWRRLLLMILYKQSAPLFAVNMREFESFQLRRADFTSICFIFFLNLMFEC